MCALSEVPDDCSLTRSLSRSFVYYLWQCDCSVVKTTVFPSLLVANVLSVMSSSRRCLMWLTQTDTFNSPSGGQSSRLFDIHIPTCRDVCKVKVSWVKNSEFLDSFLRQRRWRCNQANDVEKKLRCRCSLFERKRLNLFIESSLKQRNPWRT